MRINRSAIKNNAKIIISSTKPSPLLVALVYIAAAYVLNLLTNMISGSTHMLNEAMEQFAAGNYGYVPTLPAISAMGYVFLVAIGLMSLMLNVGFISFCLNACRQKKAGFYNLMDGFTIFFKVVWLNIVVGFFIWLWSLLFIIPGIVAAYRYRMAFYILLENPELSALECIGRSKAMMYGRKAELFILDLSFIGWNLLTFIPFAGVWVTPYTEITYVNYYLALRDMPSDPPGSR